MSDRVAMRIVVSGSVQGVGFRDFVRRTGAGLGLTGWVRNLRDGRVEAHAEGAAAAVRALLQACRNGPPAARVSSVDAVPAETLAPSGFEIRASGPPMVDGGYPTPGAATFQSPDG